MIPPVRRAIILATQLHSYIILSDIDQFSVVNQDILYYANSTVIKMVKIKIDISDGETKELTFKDEEVLTYKINAPCKLHGIFETGFSKND